MIGRIKEKFKRAFGPIARVLGRTGVPPNLLTILGPIIAVFAALYYIWQNLLAALLLLLLSSFVDALDGAVARAQKRTTTFGGVLDSVCDRYSDAIVLFGIILGGWLSSSWGSLWGILALVGSLMVSYARARAEAAGVSQLGVGIAERPERLIILMGATLLQYLTFSGFLFAPPIFFDISHWLEYGIILIAILAHITVLQRTVAAYRALSRQSKEQEQQQESEGTA